MMSTIIQSAKRLALCLLATTGLAACGPAGIGAGAGAEAGSGAGSAKASDQYPVSSVTSDSEPPAIWPAEQARQAASRQHAQSDPYAPQPLSQHPPP